MDASLANLNTTRDKIKVVAIIWNKVGSKYIFFNANVVSVGIPASTDFEADTNNDLIVTQNESKSVIVDIKNIVLDQDAVLNISDISGRLLASQQVFKNNSNQILTLSGDFNPGVHIITLVSDKKRISKKLVLH